MSLLRTSAVASRSFHTARGGARLLPALWGGLFSGGTDSQVKNVGNGSDAHIQDTATPSDSSSEPSSSSTVAESSSSSNTTSLSDPPSDTETPHWPIIHPTPRPLPADLGYGEVFKTNKTHVIPPATPDGPVLIKTFKAFKLTAEDKRERDAKIVADGGELPGEGEVQHEEKKQKRWGNRGKGKWYQGQPKVWRPQLELGLEGEQVKRVSLEEFKEDLVKFKKDVREKERRKRERKKEEESVREKKPMATTTTAATTGIQTMVSTGVVPDGTRSLHTMTRTITPYPPLLYKRYYSQDTDNNNNDNPNPISIKYYLPSDRGSLSVNIVPYETCWRPAFTVAFGSPGETLEEWKERQKRRIEEAKLAPRTRKIYLPQEPPRRDWEYEIPSGTRGLHTGAWTTSTTTTWKRFYSQSSSSNSESNPPIKVYTYPLIKSLITTPFPSSASKPLLIDVREPSEYAAGHIPTALNVPIVSRPDAFSLAPEDFEDAFGFSLGASEEEGEEEERELVFYCKAGIRSATAARLAREKGRVRVGEYPGSWMDWCENGGEKE